MMAIPSQDRERIESEYRRLQKEIERERKQGEIAQKEQTRVRLEEAEHREARIRERLDRVGLADLITTGVHTVRWDGDGAHPEVWACIPGGQGGRSESVVLELLRRLEAIVSV